VKTIIFACVHNAGRSQMAAALFNALADPSKARAVSAGTTPLATVSVRRSSPSCARKGSTSATRALGN
jgi:protein-tyrosine-phosphatase